MSLCGGSNSVEISNMSGDLKKGYLRRYGGFLFKSWKKRYFVLYQDGHLAWYEGPGGSREGLVNIKREVSMLRIGQQCSHDAPKLPSVHDNIGNMIALSTTGKKTHYVLSADQNELIAWLQALHQARGLPPPNQQNAAMPQVNQSGAPPPGFQPNVTQDYPPPYPGLPSQQGFQQGGRPYPVQRGGGARGPAQQTVVVQNDRGGGGDGFATGMMLGATMGYGWGYGPGLGWGWGH
ncbi:uncharacterized protein LOC102804980, partial [Saccoglossus kowalevskii]